MSKVHLNNKKEETDLLFYTDNPHASYTAIGKAYKDFKMSGNKSMRQLFLDTTPKSNINLSHNGPGMVQGPEPRYNTFE